MAISEYEKLNLIFSFLSFFSSKALGGNVIFRPLIEISLFFLVQILLINEHLFCKYFVRLSVGNATKGFATYGCFHPCFI